MISAGVFSDSLLGTVLRHRWRKVLISLHSDRAKAARSLGKELTSSQFQSITLPTTVEKLIVIGRTSDDKKSMRKVHFADILLLKSASKILMGVFCLL